MLARILASVGFPVAAVGLTILGMATSASVPAEHRVEWGFIDMTQFDLGLWLIIGGLIVGIIGVIMYRAAESRA